MTEEEQKPNQWPEPQPNPLSSLKIMVLYIPLVYLGDKITQRKYAESAHVGRPTPSAELYTMNIVAHSRTNQQVETVERRSEEDDVAIEAALCDPRWIRDSNKASMAHWEACGEDAGDWAAQAAVHGSPEPFMRATPYLRRNVAGVKRHREKRGRPPDNGEVMP